MGVRMGVREEGDDIRWRVVSLVTIDETATVGPKGLSWRRGVKCAVEVVRGRSGAIKEVRERQMRGVSRTGGSSSYLRLLLG